MRYAKFAETEAVIAELQASVGGSIRTSKRGKPYLVIDGLFSVMWHKENSCFKMFGDFDKPSNHVVGYFNNIDDVNAYFRKNLDYQTGDYNG